ncbi:hypothetical protein PTI98_010479 [Pleurotus ostreatus]|nr:hypothetical protein PTI98_010479 [Pleurotus ostreatus]
MHSSLITSSGYHLNYLTNTSTREMPDEERTTTECTRWLRIAGSEANILDVTQMLGYAPRHLLLNLTTLIFNVLRTNNHCGTALGISRAMCGVVLDHLVHCQSSGY